MKHKLFIAISKVLLYLLSYEFIYKRFRINLVKHNTELGIKYILHKVNISSNSCTYTYYGVEFYNSMLNINNIKVYEWVSLNKGLDTITICEKDTIAYKDI